MLAVPVIIKQPVSATVEERQTETVVTNCAAAGMGFIQYQWQKYVPFNNSWMVPFLRLVNVTSPTLKFITITEEDEGIYRCTVMYDHGRVVSENATVTVYGKITYKSFLATIHCIAQNFDGGNLDFLNISQKIF